MKKILVLICMAIVGLAAASAGVRQETQAQPGPSQAELDKVMRAFAITYADHPHYYEYGGVVVMTPDGYAASAPVTDGHATNLDIDEDPESYEGHYPIVSDYHTHPCIEGYVPSVFSPADLGSMRSSGHPGYILDECTGDVHYWAPGDPYDKPPYENITDLLKANVATGRVVGHIEVDGKKITL